MPSQADDAGAPDDQTTHEWAARADRLAPLIDGEEYFPAVRSSMIAARRQILIVGWELHSEVALLRGDRAETALDEDGYPVTLADLLQRLVEERDTLHVYLLIWSGASLFALEREHFPRMKRPWEQHPRIRLEWAEDTPKLGSHHQKVVVVDDRVAFTGGMDLTKSRWDAHDHRTKDERRRKPGMIPTYGNPYHDTMSVLDGPIARTLGGFARDRWERATTECLAPPDPAPDSDQASYWPARIEPLLTDRVVTVALTHPDHGGRPEKRQVEAAFIEHIRAARRLIYIETQYLASESLVDELARRLSSRDGPEIVVILPYGCPGLLQSMALDHQRDRLIRKLREADPGGRCGVYWPTLAGGDQARPFETSVYVHSKVMVVDDRILRIGSANLNNRSMGLDTELDTWVEAEDHEDDVRDAIASFRRRSLAYLLGVDPDRIAEAERGHGSLVAAIEALRSGNRTLHPFEHEAPEYSKAVPLDIRLADPDRPLDDIDSDKVLRAIAEDAGLGRSGRRTWAIGIGLARRHKKWLIAGGLVFVIGAVAWLTPLGELVTAFDPEAAIRAVHGSPLGMLGGVVVIVMLGGVGVPITALVVGAGAVIDSWWAVPISMLGVLGASAPGFAFGRLAPESMLPSLKGRRIRSALDALQKHGVLAVAALRNLPIAPFAVVNAALGVTELKWSTYLIGTAVGMFPGVVLLSLFGQGVAEVLSQPSPANVATLIGVVLGIIAVSVVMQRVLNRFGPSEPGEPERDP